MTLLSVTGVTVRRIAHWRRQDADSVSVAVILESLKIKS